MKIVRDLKFLITYFLVCNIQNISYYEIYIVVARSELKRNRANVMNIYPSSCTTQESESTDYFAFFYSYRIPFEVSRVQAT